LQPLLLDLHPSLNPVTRYDLSSADATDPIGEATPTALTSNYSSSNLLNVTARGNAPGLIDQLVQTAVGVIAGANAWEQHLWKLLARTKGHGRANQGWRISMAPIAPLESEVNNYVGFRFGRFFLVLGVDGSAKLFGLPYNEGYETTPNPSGEGLELLDTWRFETPTSGMTFSKLTILPEWGSLCFYLKKVDRDSQNALMAAKLRSAAGPSTEGKHRFDVPLKYLQWHPDNNEWWTVAPSYLDVWGSVAFSHHFLIERVCYPYTGKYISNAEQLLEATTAAQTEQCESWDYVPNECTATMKLVDGDTCPGGTAVDWTMDPPKSHPRMQVDLARPLDDPYVTPYHYGHKYEFDPVLIEDPRTKLTFYNPYRISITKTQTQSKDSANVELVLGIPAQETPQADSVATIEAAFEILMNRADSPVRIWYEVDPLDRTKDILYWAGYIDPDNPPQIEWLDDGKAHFKIKLTTMHLRLRETTILRGNIYDNMKMLDGLKDMIKCAGFDVTSKFRIATADAEDLEEVRFPGDEASSESTATNAPAYQPKGGVDVEKILDASLQLFYEQFRDLQLNWIADDAAFADDGRKAELWEIRARLNPPRPSIPPTAVWEVCEDHADLYGDNGLLVIGKPELKIYVPEANAVYVVTEATGDTGALSISEQAMNEASKAALPESTLDPNHADYLGRPKRTFYINSEMKGQQTKEWFDGLAQEILEVMGHTYYELTLPIIWNPNIKVDDYVNFRTLDGELWKSFWIVEASVDYDNKTEDVGRIVLRTVWTRPN